MKRRHLLMVLPLAVTAWSAGAEVEPPSPSSKKVQFTATITKVLIAFRQGTPSLMLDTPNGPLKLYLGPMRYLLEQDFRPVAGETAEVEAFQNGSEAVAIRVRLPKSDVTLRLRDSDGRPVWQRHGPHGCPHCGRQAP